MGELSQHIHDLLKTRSALKQSIFRNTNEQFLDMKRVIKTIQQEQSEKIGGIDPNVVVEYTENGSFEAQLKFSGDVLLFYQHTNVFTFPPDHFVYSLPYVKENPERAYFGVIHIYNFLADSFKYMRMNDVGYLLARIFVNSEDHFFIDGRKPLSFLFADLPNQVLNEDTMRRIVEHTMINTIDFDLMVPPFDQVAAISVGQKITRDGNTWLSTGKRLGFPYSDHV